MTAKPTMFLSLRLVTRTIFRHTTCFLFSIPLPILTFLQFHPIDFAFLMKGLCGVEKGSFGVLEELLSGETRLVLQ